jgi:hypothetical protein
VPQITQILMGSVESVAKVSRFTLDIAQRANIITVFYVIPSNAARLLYFSR